MITLSKSNLNLRPETTLGQIWETVRQWILNSPYSKFKKVPQKLPTKISEGEFEWCANETKDDLVTLSRVGDGMTIISSRIRRGLKWNTVLKFTRLKKLVKGTAEMHIEGSIPEGVGEVKVSRVVRQLLKTYGVEEVGKRKVSATTKPVAKAAEGQEPLIKYRILIDFTVRSSICKFCINCILRQFAFLEDIRDVSGDDGLVAPEEATHLF